MSLNNITLSPIVLDNLFKYSLLDFSTKTNQNIPTKSTSLSYLGNNEKHIAIVVFDDKALYLAEEDLKFLIGILSACQLSMADVALVNWASAKTLTHTTLQEELQSQKILLFGVTPSQMQLPLQFPHYQIQAFNNQIYLAAPALNIIALDKTKKTTLWACLKQIFLPS